MKLDQICRTCLREKANLKPIFEACVPNMLMSCASIQVMINDGLPNQICTQCLQSVNKAYTFKQLCEKSDMTLREYLQIRNISLPPEGLINTTEQFFNTSDDLQQTSIFQDIFNDTTHSIVDNFATQNNSTVVSDLAETVQSLQIIAEQCLPESWDGDQIASCSNSMPTAQNTFHFDLYKCDYCGDSFKDNWSLDEHVKSHSTDLLGHTLDKPFPDDSSKLFDKPFLCNICDRIFMDNKNLKKHMREVHFIIDQVVNDVEKKFSCNICGRKYKHNKNLSVHLRSSHGAGARPYRCTLCDATFALASSWHKHRLVHMDDKRHQCPVCGKKFRQSSNLNGHMKTHTGDKRHVCAVCEKRFATSSSLDVHMRSHTGIKPYMCQSCDRCFASATELKKHSMKHTGERPYSCWHCGKSFSRKETRDTHVRYHTGQRPYACTICPKKYIAASHLRTHTKSHTMEEKNQSKMDLNKHQVGHEVHPPNCNCNLCASSQFESCHLLNHL
ncbi:zinc finger protein 558 [Aethina tumida]|uniref:zinc finger protein 558 n=1 Tax=Aethina tumida TaxID=116153 RepID=UPI002148A9B5|nr:zinc finger protein 558 [Aethina tumida]